MNCNELKPGDSWRTCDKDLKHAGDHRYLNETWPRVVPNEPDPDVEALLKRTRPARTWGVDERSFPIVVIETVTRVLWVDAETEDDALDYWARDYTDIKLDDAQVLDGDLEFRRLDEFERFGMTGAPIGPQIACPGCGALAMSRSWHHRPLRKCHGPIEWTTWTAASGRFVASRKHEAHAGQAVAS